VELYFHSPNTPSWRGARLREAQGQFYLDDDDDDDDNNNNNLYLQLQTVDLI
jgi:hypothetical protein